MPGVNEMADEATGKIGKEAITPDGKIKDPTPAETDILSEITPEEDALQAKEILQDMVAGIAASAMIIGIIGSLIIQSSRIPFCLGVLLGAGTAGLMLWHMYVTIDRALDMDADSAVKYTKKSATLRILMAGAAFVIGAFLPKIFHLIGVLLGTLCLKFSAYLQPLTHKALKNFRKGR